MANIKNIVNLLDDDEEFIKTKSRFSKIESDVEDGELSSDIDDDSNLEKLFKNMDDRKRLFSMSEKEREEEIFKRSLELSDIKSRQRVVKKLNEQKRQEDFQTLTNKKRSLDDVFGHCSDEEILLSSSSFDSDSMSIKKFKVSPQINSRQRTLEDQKRSKNDILSQLIENRKLKLARLEKLEKIPRIDHPIKPLFESDSSDSEEKKINNVDRLSIISSSSSERIDEIRVAFDEKCVEELDDLLKIRLTRNQMENWVHMPFFKELVKGCFVRVNIGDGPEVIPVYRIAEVIEVVETAKVYDLGKTRTNAGLKLRIGNSVTMFRLLFVSNQSFTKLEFDNWRQWLLGDGFPVPKLSFIEGKCKQLQEYSNFSINNEETMKQVLISKQRFQKGPVNMALRKAELTRLKMAAENAGDVTKVSEYQDEIEELNIKAEKLERRRTEGIKNISYINQRNREITMEHVEKAIRLEMAEKLEWEKKGGDPLDREPTKPILNYKKRKQERIEKEAQILKQLQEATDEANTGKEDSPLRNSTKIDLENKINIQTNNDFDVSLDTKDGGANHASTTVSAKSMGISESMMSAISNSLGYNRSPPNTLTGPSLANRRVLNLQDYKRRKGLI